ncbi:acyl-CoA dehydrogenase family protein [Marinobacter caseinilyticus]|uniref:acyl-CoA dehydrogenase family protein n=1 Tax=Marinobacter caseinilyticus TaxID=2692195 RepID=UPI00140BC560|nr:acyl-CoA dehydrogenase [Marinobacter caseinilyticus]
MNFNLTDEQQMLQDSLRRFLANEYGFEKRGQIIASGQGRDNGTWQALAEMGLLGFTFPEAHDGLGGNAIDTMLVMESFGRALVVEPYLATVVLGGGLVRDAGSEAQKAAILPAITAGEHFMAFAHSEPGARYHLNQVSTKAAPSGDDFVINGHKTAVLHGAQADQLIVSARTIGADNDAYGLTLFLIDRTAEGVTVSDFATHDGHRTAEIRFTNVTVGSAALLGPQDRAAAVIEKATDLAIAALCAEAVGVMEAMNAATLEYTRTRKQFGVPIAKFQVLQHNMADMFIATEQARSMAILAASEADSDDRARRRTAVSMAKTLVGQSARAVGQKGVQLHGGMGVTDEMFAAHLFKRLTLINLLFGDADHHLAQVSDALLAKSA